MFTESIFLRRHWDHDRQIIARDLKCIRDYPDGYWVTVCHLITYLVTYLLVYHGRSWVRLPAGALSGNDLGQVVHTNVPLFTKQYKLVPCEGFHVNVPVCGSHGMKSNEQGEYCRSGSAAIESLKTAI